MQSTTGICSKNTVKQNQKYREHSKVLLIFRQLHEMQYFLFCFDKGCIYNEANPNCLKNKETIYKDSVTIKKV